MAANPPRAYAHTLGPVVSTALRVCARTAIVGLVLCAPSCLGAAEPSYTTTQGFRVYTHDNPLAPDRAAMSGSIDAVVQALHDHDPILYDLARVYAHLANAGSGYSVHVRDAPLKCTAAPVEGCAGLFHVEARAVEYVQTARCLAVTALQHELTHALRHALTGDSGPQHTAPGFFARSCYVESPQGDGRLVPRPGPSEDHYRCLRATVEARADDAVCRTCEPGRCFLNSVSYKGGGVW